MKGLKILIAAVAVIGLAANGALACGHSCGGQASAQQASACAAKGATAQTADAKGGCPAMAAAGASCHGSAAAAAGACCAGAKGASASCSGSCDFAKGGCCPMTNVQYRVSADGHEMKTFDRAKAFAFAEAAQVPIHFYVMDTAYDSESDANTALLTSLRQRMNDLLTMQYVVNGEAVKCGKSASDMASSCQGKVTYRVAAHDFAERAAAEAYMQRLQAAIASVKVMDPDGKPVEGCAASHAKQCGNKNLTFKVGDEVAGDAVTANVLQAREQLRLILTAQA